MADTGDPEVEFVVDESAAFTLEVENHERSEAARRAGHLNERGEPVYQPLTLRDLAPANFTNPNFCRAYD